MQAPEGSGVQWTRGFGEGAREWESEGQLGSLDCCAPVTFGGRATPNVVVVLERWHRSHRKKYRVASGSLANRRRAQALVTAVC